MNEKDGRAGDLDFGLSASFVEIIKTDSCVSVVDRERLPVALENDEGAEEEEGLAGKTKCGFGGGNAVRGDDWEASRAGFFNDALSAVA